MSRELPFRDLDEEVQVACFLSLLTMAAIDREIHPKERRFILQLAIDESTVADRVESEFARFLEHPVALRPHLLKLRGLSRRLRARLFLALVDVVLADEDVKYEEAKALLVGGRLLRLMDAFREEDEPIAKRVRRLRHLADASTAATRQVIDEVLGLVLLTSGTSAKQRSEIVVPEKEDSALDRLLVALRESKARARHDRLIAELNQP